MRPLRYAINVTLDGCCDHMAVVPDEETHRFWSRTLADADAVLYGRVTYQMMEEAWRRPGTGSWPDWMDEADIAFAEVIDAKPKHVVSATLDSVDWNTEVVTGDLATAVRELKARSGGEILLGGLTLPLALADLDLIDEYLFVVHPVIAGHGPRLLDGLHQSLDLELTDRRELGSGAVVLHYEPRRSTG